MASAPGTAFAGETVAEPSTVRPGGATIVIVGCGTDAGRATDADGAADAGNVGDAGSVTASSSLFGEVVLSHAVEPGYYRARVVVPPTAAAGTYAVTGSCGTATSTGTIVVVPGREGPATGKGNGPTLIGLGLIAAGAALAVLATRYRYRTRA